MKYNDIENKIKQELQNQTPNWDKGAFWNDLEKELPVAASKPWWRKILPIALAVLLIGGTSLFVYNQYNTNANQATINEVAINNSNTKIKQDQNTFNKNRISNTTANQNNNIEKANSTSKTIYNTTQISKPTIEKEIAKQSITKPNKKQNRSRKTNDEKVNTNKPSITKQQANQNLIKAPIKKQQENNAVVSTKNSIAKTNNFRPSSTVTKEYNQVNEIKTSTVPVAIPKNEVSFIQPETQLNTVVKQIVKGEKVNTENSLVPSKSIKSAQKETTAKSSIAAVKQNINNALVRKNVTVTDRLTSNQTKSITSSVENDWSINTEEKPIDFPTIKIEKDKKFSAEAYVGVGATKRNLTYDTATSYYTNNPFSANEDAEITQVELLDLKKTNEVQLENYKAGIRLSYKINKNLKVSTGLEHLQINEKFSYTDSFETNDVIQSDSARYYIVNGQEIFFPGELNRQTITTREIELYNRHSQFNIPFQVGLTFGKSKWNHEAYVGFGLNVSNISKDKYLQYTFDNNIEWFAKRNVNNLQAGFKTAFQMNKNVEFTAGLHYDYMLNDIFSSSDGFSSKYQLLGLQTGIRTRF